MEYPETPNFDEQDLIESDQTFNRLKELQNLLKKESSLRELCK